MSEPCPLQKNLADPFREHRARGPVVPCEFQGENLPMIVRHAEVRQAARDWKTFSSDAPFRVPIPSEEDKRSVRQLPIETDPPDHAEYRAIVEPFFQRAKSPEMIARVEALFDELLDAALTKGSLEVVGDFALRAQSRALTYLLDVPETEADRWIEWGVHVFHGDEGTAKGVQLHRYIEAQLDAAEALPADDFFSALVSSDFRGRRLTREEALGFANLTFAGGRDTIIHTISCTLAHLASVPADLEFLRADPKRITLASEELFRVFMPLNHIGRVCPVHTNVHGIEVPAGGRVALGWAAANRDESVFPHADEIHLDRKPNPHLSFGFGEHLCLGAPHARLMLRTLLRKCAEKVRALEIVSAEDHFEREASYERRLGYESLWMRFEPLV